MQRLILGTALIAATGTGMTTLESCSPDTCTLEARPSVRVEIVDTDGEPIPAHAVWYRVAAPTLDAIGPDSSQQAECIDLDCTTWAAGREVPGEIEVHAAACGNAKSRSVTVPMTADDCHVDTQTIEFEFECDDTNFVDPTADAAGPELTPVPQPPLVKCSHEPQPSVLVSVIESETGALLPADNVAFTVTPFEEAQLDSPAAGDLSLPPVVGQGVCTSDLCSVWEVGYDRTGHFDIWADACGQTSEVAEVDVMPGVCHPEQRDVMLTIDCAPR